MCLPCLALLGLNDANGNPAKDTVKPQDWLFWGAIAIGAGFIIFDKPSVAEKSMSNNPKKRKKSRARK